MKKVLVLTLAFVLVAAMSVGLTLAFLTDEASVTNTFEVGKVDIDLTEAPVDLYGDVVDGDRVKANKYKLIPGHEYAKDPIVYVTEDSEKCYVFVKVENGLAAIEAADNNIAAQIIANGWTAYTDGVYYKVVDPDVDTDLDLEVFEKFTLANDAEVAGYASANITVTAYAVQFDGMEDVDAAWNAAIAE